MASNGAFDEIPECPLCLEPLGLDDINFYPCACRYQICRFCWHRIRTDENGLCPHCREVYPENPAEYTPPTAEQLAKNKTEKKQKEVYKRQKVMESREKLALVRVVQRNLVFVIGLSPRLADPEVLKRNEYFGKYGKIYKVVINNHTIYNGAQGPSVSAYVTYCRNEDASKAIAAVNNAFIDGRSLKASFGTTKYCTSFLKGTPCTKSDCMYLHELGEDQASFTKEDMQLGKHQMFENATLASSLPTVTGGKEHAPSVIGEGGVTIKHTVLPTRNKESVQADLTAESALPATAHWASNQKGQGGGGGGSSSDPSDQTNSKQSDTSKQTKVPTGTSSTSSSSKRHAAASGPGKRTHSKDSQSSGGSQEETPLTNTSSKPLSRPGSVSPGTLKSGGHARTTVGLSRAVSEPNKENIRINHSRGSSMTQSLTPNLSPRSTISDSSSSAGSLRQEVDDVIGSVRARKTLELEIGGSEGVSSVSSEGERVECEFGAEVVKEDESISSESVKQEGTIDVQQQQQQTRLAHFKSDTRPSKEGTGVSSLPAVEGGGGSSPPISSPPGLSKTRAQPLSLSRQSELVCRQLELSGPPVLDRNTMVVVNNPVQQQQQRVDLAGRGVAAQQPAVMGAVEGKSEKGVVGSTSLGPNVMPSLPSAGSGHFGALGVNWGLAPNTGLASFPPSVPHQHPRHAPNPSPAPSSSSSSSQPRPPQDPNPAPLTGNSLITVQQQQQQSSSSSHALPPAPSLNSQTEAHVDDGDELGFDPWDISQQGLADLLETEAEQKQTRPLVGVASHPTLSSAGSTNKKRAPNGFRPYLDNHGLSLYKSWQDSPPTSSTPSSSAPSSVAGGGMCDTGSRIGGGAFTTSNQVDSVQDEFRALFPNVNISFGGSSKSEKASSLVQAIDASNPTPTSSSYHPSQLATAVNYSYQGHAHPGTKFTDTPGGLPNPFLGQSQPGFPSSCFRVKGHSGGTTSVTTTPTAKTAATTTSGNEGNNMVNSYSTCLGPDWPDLGITIGQNKTQSKLVPAMMGAGLVGKGSEAGAGGGVVRKTAGKVVAVVDTSVSNEAVKVNKPSVTVASSSSAPTVTVPPPPPGFSNKTPATANPLSTAATLSSAGPSSTTTTTAAATSAGTGSGNQTVTTSGSQTVNPLLLANGQILSNHLLQSWSNLRNLANLTPAQQQQLARANPQLTLQQQQQILAQQYLFQQALMRNPVLQAQSLRMAQQFQQAALLQQQQQQALLANRAAGTVTSSAASRTNASSSNVGSTTSQANVSKLLGTMTSVVSSTVTTPSTGTQPTISKPSAQPSGGTKSSSCFGPGGAVHNPPKVSGSSSRAHHTSAANSVKVQQAHAGSNRGQSGSSRAALSGHSRSSCQVAGGQGLNSKGSGGVDKHHQRTSGSKPASSKAKSAHQLTNPPTVRPRQKSSK